MQNILIVLKHEVLTTLSKVSFWVMTFLFPAVVILLSLGSQLIAQSASKTMVDKNPLITGSTTSSMRYSYVDQSGIIQKTPAELPAGILKQYPDEAAAKAALASGQIEWYVLIPKDYLESGRLVLVQRTFNPMTSTPEGFFQYLLVYNLSPNPELAPVLSVQDPSTLLHDIAPSQPQASQNKGEVGLMVSYGTLFIFFMLISMSSGLMLSSVSKEKSSRLAEILLTSLKPRQLMAGKLLGLSLVAMFQMIIWVTGVMVFLKQGKSLISMLSQINLPADFFLWAVLFFFLGFLLYASMMGAVGALAPDLREAGQFTFVLLLPLMIPLFVNMAFTDSPNGGLVTFLSLFPLTAPTSMLTRMASNVVPTWQIAASVGGLAVTTYLIVLLSARFFRPETLLSSASLKWGQVFSELRHAITGSS